MSWKQLESNKVMETKLFQFRIDKCETSDGRVMPRYYVLDFPAWVQVIALTKDRKIVVVDQYRYPGQGQFLELPGGTSDPRTGETVLQAAQRELLEETGYKSDCWIEVGFHYPNPALQTNQCYVFLAVECEKYCEPQLDPFEELTVRVMPIKAFKETLRSSPKAHALIMASLFLAEPHLEAVISGDRP